MAIYYSLLSVLILVVSTPLLQADEVKQSPLEVNVEVPDPTWSTKIQQVYTKEGKLLVVCKMNKKDGVGIMVISNAKDRIQLPTSLSKLPREILVTGKTWNWSNGGYTAVTDKDLLKALEGAKLVYTMPVKIEKPQPDAEFIGLTLVEAKALAKLKKLTIRVACEDGKPLALTRDYRANRVNLTIVKGKITSTSRG